MVLVAPIVLAAIGAIPGLLQAGTGFFQRRKAQDPGSRPVYEIPDTEFQAQDIYQRLAQRGFSSNALSLATDGLNRTLSTQAANIINTGGNSNQLAGVARATNDGLTSLAIQNDAKFDANQIGLAKNTQRLTDYLEKSFDFNTVQPYLLADQKYQQIINSANQNISQGLINSITGGISAGVRAQEQDDLLSFLKNNVTGEEDFDYDALVRELEKDALKDPFTDPFGLDGDGDDDEGDDDKKDSGGSTQDEVNAVIEFIQKFRKI